MKSLNTEQLLLTINYLAEDAELLLQLKQDKNQKRADMLSQQIEDRLNNIQSDIVNITEILRRYNRIIDLILAVSVGGDEVDTREES